VDSTNNYAMAKVHAGMAPEGTIFFAYEQWAGKGQRGKSWSSLPGENIIISAVLEPVFLSVTRQFPLSACVALACHDLYSRYVPSGQSSIKWPNDLYWRDRKAGGILIESICKGNDWLFAIVGIGININQVQFPDNIKNAISLKQIIGKTMKTDELAKELCGFIEKRYDELKEQKADQLLNRYNQLLYKRNQPVKLKKGNIIFETTVKEVTSQGQLLTFDAIERSFGFGEVEWIM